MATEVDRKDTVFPHSIAGAPGTAAFYDDFRRTPFADELTLEVALAAMNAHGLATDETPDVLAVELLRHRRDRALLRPGLSGDHGPDAAPRPDAAAAVRRGECEGRGLPGRSFVLTADHSVMPLVESLQKQGLAARRVTPATLQAAGMSALEKRFPGARDLVASYLAPDFYLNLDSIARQGLRRRDVEQTLGDALMATGDVAKIYTASSFRGRGAFRSPRIPISTRSGAPTSRPAART